MIDAGQVAQPPRHGHVLMAVWVQEAVADMMRSHAFFNVPALPWPAGIGERHQAAYELSLAWARPDGSLLPGQNVVPHGLDVQGRPSLGPMLHAAWSRTGRALPAVGMTGMSSGHVQGLRH